MFLTLFLVSSIVRCYFRNRVYGKGILVDEMFMISNDILRFPNTGIVIEVNGLSIAFSISI